MLKPENILWIFGLLLLAASCMTRETNLEDITEEVISKQHGVVIDIEPGQKK